MLFRSPPTDPDKLYECLGWIDPIVHSSAMYRRKIALAVGGYPERYIYAQDFALILELAQKGKLAMIPEYLCKLRVYSSNMSHSIKYRTDVIHEGLLLIKYAGEKLDLSPKGRQMNRCSIAKYEIRWALVTCCSGDVCSGFKMILRALWQEPSILWNNNLFRPRFR